jgi:uncharacterized cupin superfamily protein
VLRRVNVLGEAIAYDTEDPDGFRSGSINVTKALGASDLAVKVMEMGAGQHLCPYHYEYEEEWLIVVDDGVLVRTPEGEETFARGDIVYFPKGPAGAHRVSNPTDAPVRVIMFSSAREPSVAVYPDSDKLGVFVTDNPADTVMLHRADGDVPYFDGETA